MEETTQAPEQQPSKKSQTPLVLLGLVLIVLVGGGAYYANSHKSAAPAQTTKTVEGMQTKPTPTVVVAVTPTGTVSAEKEFTIVGKNYSFTPNTITVQKGDTVKITFTDDEGFHNLIIDGYNEKTQTIKSGNSDVIQFVADKAGTFAFYCGVGDHRERGMQGTLTVE